MLGISCNWNIARCLLVVSLFLLSNSAYCNYLNRSYINERVGEFIERDLDNMNKEVFSYDVYGPTGDSFMTVDVTKDLSWGSMVSTTYFKYKSKDFRAKRPISAFSLLARLQAELNIPRLAMIEVNYVKGSYLPSEIEDLYRFSEKRHFESSEKMIDDIKNNKEVRYFLWSDRYGTVKCDPQWNKDIFEYSFSFIQTMKLKDKPSKQASSIHNPVHGCLVQLMDKVRLDNRLSIHQKSLIFKFDDALLGLRNRNLNESYDSILEEKKTQRQRNKGRSYKQHYSEHLDFNIIKLGGAKKLYISPVDHSLTYVSPQSIEKYRLKDAMKAYTETFNERFPLLHMVNQDAIDLLEKLGEVESVNWYSDQSSGGYTDKASLYKYIDDEDNLQLCLGIIKNNDITSYKASRDFLAKRHPDKVKHYAAGSRTQKKLEKEYIDWTQCTNNMSVSKRKSFIKEAASYTNRLETPFNHSDLPTSSEVKFNNAFLKKLREKTTLRLQYRARY